MCDFAKRWIMSVQSQAIEATSPRDFDATTCLDSQDTATMSPPAIAPAAPKAVGLLARREPVMQVTMSELESKAVLALKKLGGSTMPAVKQYIAANTKGLLGGDRSTRLLV